MCDTIVATGTVTADGAVYFGKNSDREPGEAQIVEIAQPRKIAANGKLRATYIEVPDVETTREVVLSRPFWMWGAEMGANDRGVVIGNQAVFTKMQVRTTGLLGMDLLRIALERAATAEEALEVITDLIEAHGQGGAGGYRNKRFLYHNAFILADPKEAWVLETADRFWAAEKVAGVRTISNVLTIQKRFDRIADGAYDFAKSHRWTKSAGDFDFARAFGSPLMGALSGGEARRACTARSLLAEAPKIDRTTLMTALRSHAGLLPADGWRLEMPCAHASWLPTRHAGQTTGSMVSRLSERSAHWLTGTSSPCLSVYKPVLLGSGSTIAFGPAAGAGHDPESLWWRHERLHRRALMAYEGAASSIDADRRALEAEALSAATPVEASTIWETHRARIPEWTARIERANDADFRPLFRAYWARQDRLDRPR